MIENDARDRFVRDLEELEPFDVVLGGARLRYVEAGPHDAPAVVFLHGVGRDHTQWAPIARSLSSTRRTIALDLPGFGASAARAAPATFETLAEAALDLVAALKLGRVTMIGHGMGGAAALVAAADRPEFVERLVLVAPSCYRPIATVDDRLIAAPLVGRALFRRLLAASVLRRHGGPTARPSPSAYAVLAQTASPSTIEARLPRVRAPALVVWGRNDAVAPSMHGTRLARELAGARLEILDCGHFPEGERAASVENLIRGFLDESDGGRDTRAARGAVR